MTEPLIQYLQLGLVGDSAGALADLKSLAGDVQYARWCAATYLQWMTGGGPEGPDADNLKRAIWTTCCITYRRVFTNGKGHISPQQPRPKPNENFPAALTPEQLEAHNSVLDTANRHVAHRVNELEMVSVSVVLTPPPMERGIVGIGTMLAHYAGPIEVPVVERFIEVCDLLTAGTEQHFQLLSQQAVELLKQRDLDEMYAEVAKQQDQQGET
jgi:hypothetical protein